MKLPSGRTIRYGVGAVKCFLANLQGVVNGIHSDREGHVRFHRGSLTSLSEITRGRPNLDSRKPPERSEQPCALGLRALEDSMPSRVFAYFHVFSPPMCR